jgi:DNA/RNA endonuclease YhcR with UshA esterase domain
MQKTLASLAAAAALALGAPAGAHHFWTAEYDMAKPVTVKGVVVKVEWTNPHTHFYVEAKDEKGVTTTWNFEMASTLSLERAGWSRKTVQVGDQVTITGYGGRTAIERAVAATMTAADGRELFVGKPGQ